MARKPEFLDVDFASLVQGFSAAAEKHPELVQQEMQRAIGLGVTPGEQAKRIARISVGVRLLEEQKGMQPLSAEALFQSRDIDTIRRDAFICTMLEGVTPAKPIAIGQITEEFFKRKSKKMSETSVAQRLLVILEAGWLEEKYVYSRLDLYPELFEDPEISARADKDEPQTIKEALSLIIEVKRGRAARLAGLAKANRTKAGKFSPDLI